MNLISVQIYKEKRKKNFRIVIFPTSENRMGLRQSQNCGIVIYFNKKDEKKIGNCVLWALNESIDNFTTETAENKFEKIFNENSYKKILEKYNYISFRYSQEKYFLKLCKKYKDNFIEFKDENGNHVEYEFKEKPSPNELGTKVMEMFEYKEKYDEQ